jgi:hypothetical protein
MKRDFGRYTSKWIEITQGDFKKRVCLIAHYHCNSVSVTSGYVVYSTENPDTWSIHDAKPLVDMILCSTPEEAIELGEQIVIFSRLKSNAN